MYNSLIFSFIANAVSSEDFFLRFIDVLELRKLRYFICIHNTCIWQEMEYEAVHNMVLQVTNSCWLKTLSLRPSAAPAAGYLS